MNTNFKAVLFSAAVLVSGCSQAKNVEESNSMLDLKNTKDWCVGRYAFKLPKNAVLTGGTDFYNSFKITSYTNANTEKLNKEYADAIKEYNVNTRLRKLIFELPTKVSGSKTIKIFSGKLGSNPISPKDLFGFVLERGTLFKIEISYVDEKKDLVTSELNRIVNGISARSNNSIPKEKGICIANGFIQDDGKEYRKSKNTVPFDFSGYPSVKMSLEAEAITYPQADLLTTMKGNLKERGIYSLTSSSFKTIRKGNKNQTSGDLLTGQEWLSQAPMQGQNGAIATWEHAGTVQNALDPVLQLDVDSGFDGNNIKTASLNEKETIQLYEFILNSIRKF